MIIVKPVASKCCQYRLKILKTRMICFSINWVFGSLSLPIKLASSVTSLLQVAFLELIKLKENKKVIHQVDYENYKT